MPVRTSCNICGAVIEGQPGTDMRRKMFAHYDTHGSYTYHMPERSLHTPLVTVPRRKPMHHRQDVDLPTMSTLFGNKRKKRSNGWF